MIRSFKYRLYPNQQQVAALEIHLREACDLYNCALEERIGAWKTCRISVSFRQQSAQLKDLRRLGLVGIANFDVADNVLKRLDLAFAAFYRRLRSGERPGYPRFRSARRYDSIVFPKFKQDWSMRGERIHLHGIGDVKLRQHRVPVGRMRTASIKRQAGRWFVIIVCDGIEPIERPILINRSVGIDLGLNHFAILSDGSEIDNPRELRKAEAGLRRANRHYSRTRAGSKGRTAASARVAAHYWRMANRRSDFAHKLSYYFVSRYSLIAVENLNVKGLAASRLAKSVNDAAWSSFLQKLAYKAESAGCELVRVDPRGTSQQCSNCLEVVPKLLSQRQHVCSCGFSASRDHNAALNILRLGMSLAAQTKSTGSSVAAEVRSA